MSTHKPMFVFFVFCFFVVVFFFVEKDEKYQYFWAGALSEGMNYVSIKVNK